MAARVSSRIEPLAAQRYKVQLTAGAELARKLELARDLMRHSHPDGELGPIVERALDLLIESLMRQRFGKKAPHPARQRSVQAGPEQQGGVVRHGRTPNTTTSDTSPTDDGTTTSDPATIGAAEVHGNLCAEPQRASASPHSPHIPRGARRAVVERDGLGCSWVDERGVRCASRAWLEYDHRHPRAKGGGSEPDNLRLLCRAHNRFAAEREYGRKHVERTIAERRRQRAADSSPAI